MLTSSRSLFASASVALLGSALVASAPARAQSQEEVINKVKDLNKKAIDAYENLDLEEARKFLTQALEMCASEGLNNHPVKAVSHLNLGIIFVGGFKQHDQGLKQFKRALEIDPGVKVAKRLQNPEINAAFDEAKGAAPVAPAPAPATPAPMPAAPAPAPVAAAKPRADGPPANVKGVHHQPVTEADPGATIVIKAAVEPALGAAKVILAYRTEGTAFYLQRDLEADGSGWLVARIPQAATNGPSVSYYIEAHDKLGKPLASNGSAAQPHVVTIGGTPGEAKGTDEPSRPRRPGSFAGKIWIGIGIGGGGGYVKGSPEVFAPAEGQSLDFSGVANAQLLHFTPEIGFALRDDLLLSLQGRFQLVTGASKVRGPGCGADGMSEGICTPATGAIAVLAKATYIIGSYGAFRPTVGVAAGGGQIRYLVDLTNKTGEKCGENGGASCFDTVAAGTFMVGPTAGVMYDVSDLMTVTAGVNALYLMPNTALNFDVNVGLAASF